MNSFCIEKTGILFLVISILTVSGPAFSQQSDNLDKEKIDFISKVAHDACERVPLSGSSSKKEFEAEAKAGVDGFLKKFSDVHVDGKVEASSSSYQGVFQKDLADVLKHSIDCKKDLFTLLVNKLITTPANVPGAELKQAVPDASEGLARHGRGEVNTSASSDIDDQKKRSAAKPIKTVKANGLGITYFPVVTTYASNALNLKILFENTTNSDISILFGDGYAVLNDYSGEKNTSNSIDGVRFNGNGKWNILNDGAKLFHNEATTLSPGSTINATVHFSANGKNKNDIVDAFVFNANLFVFDGREYKEFSLSTPPLPLLVFMK